jgi:hypothetical protein
MALAASAGFIRAGVAMCSDPEELVPPDRRSMAEADSQRVIDSCSVTLW